MQDGIRKAAILVGALDRASADRLLDLFPPADAQAIRQAVVDLGDVSSDVQRKVLDEFFAAGRGQRRADFDGLDLSDAARNRGQRRFGVVDRSGNAQPAEEDAAAPFRFLKEAEADRLARALSAERPQTVALVLSHLPAEQSGAVLVRLEAALQVEVVRRLVDLEETDPEILHEVERALESRLSQQVKMQRRRVAGLKAVEGILQAAPAGVGAKILANLTARDRGLAERLGPEPLVFDDLATLDADAWDVLVSEADAELLTLALFGAAPALCRRVLDCLADDQRQALRAKLDNPGPIRLRDVEEARAELADLARRMVLAGRIELPASGRRLAVSAAA